jgi:hypothetical protein
MDYHKLNKVATQTADTPTVVEKTSTSSGSWNAAIDQGNISLTTNGSFLLPGKPSNMHSQLYHRGRSTLQP